MLREGEFRNPSGCASLRRLRPGRGKAVRRDDRRIHRGDARALQRSWRRVRRLRHLSRVSGRIRPAHLLRHPRGQGNLRAVSQERHFDIVNLSKIPTRKVKSITGEPLIWRYFCRPLPTKLAESQLMEAEFTMRSVMRINTEMDGAYVFSSGRNMGVFKAVGYPEDVAEFYRLDEYRGYGWTAHGRYPTNTPGWWGGPSLRLTRVFHRPQRRNLLLRRQPADHRDVRLTGALCRRTPR